MMHLKFPLPTGYFPKFELTPDETLAYKELVTDLVKDTRREHETYVKDGQRHVDTRKWKLAKTKDRLHIYKRRSEYGATAIGLTGHSHGGGSSSSGSYDHSASAFRSGSESSSSNGFSLSSASTSTGHVRGRVSSTLSNGSSHSSSHNASLGVLDEASTTGLHRRLLEPTFLATGVIDGSVDDLIYGFHEATADATKTTAALIGDDQLIDTVVLHTIKASKTTYLGLKWKLCRTPGGNRDMCFIEYVGVANDAKGERYGFKVIESVKLRNCPAFDDNSIIRTNLSFRYLFRESGTPGIVDVYMQGAFDSSGDAVTAGGVGDARSTMEILMEVENRMEIAESKKLADLVAAQARAPPKPKQSGSQCSICRAKPGLLSSHLLCNGCGAVICTKCRVKKVVVVVKRGSASKNKISCCKICLVNAKETSPFAGEPIPTPQAPLKQLQKKPSVSSMSMVPHSGNNTRSGSSADQGPLATTQELALALPQAKQLERHRTADSFVDTEYSGSMQSWQSSSVSSSYSDLDDSYGSSHTSPGGQLALMHNKMPMVAESPRVRHGHHGHHAQLPQYAYQGQQQQHAVGMYNNQGDQYSQGQYGRAPPPMRPTANADQHRMGLYNQMIELQMKAERAHNLANQNAAFMQQGR